MAITRAREQTTIYAADQPDETSTAQDQLSALAQRMSRTEPDVPSIHTPLAHEQTITTAADHARRQATQDSDPRRGADRVSDPQSAYVTAVLGQRPDATTPGRHAWDQAAEALQSYRDRYQIDPDEQTALGAEPRAGNFKQRHQRNQAARQVLNARRALGHDQPEHGPLSELGREIPGLVPARDEQQREQAHRREL